MRFHACPEIQTIAHLIRTRERDQRLEALPFHLPLSLFCKRRAQRVILSERAERARAKDLLLGQDLLLTKDLLLAPADRRAVEAVCCRGEGKALRVRSPGGGTGRILKKRILRACGAQSLP
jgi:hypothetical protein